MYSNLNVGQQIIFPDTPHNRETLMGSEQDWDYSYSGFDLEVAYTVAGHDLDGRPYFFDGAGHKNYAGCDEDGSSGDYQLIN